MNAVLYNEHNVWKILKKDRYTEEGVKRIEGIYDFFAAMQKTVGELPMRELFNMWNENSDETFLILSQLVHSNNKEELNNG